MKTGSKATALGCILATVVFGGCRLEEGSLFIAEGPAYHRPAGPGYYYGYPRTRTWFGYRGAPYRNYHRYDDRRDRREYWRDRHEDRREEWRDRREDWRERRRDD